MAATKVLIPLVGLGVAAAAFLSRSKDASAAPGPGAPTPTGPGNIPGVSPTVVLPGATAQGLPADVIARMVAALSSGDPAKIRAEAARLEKEGYTVQAADLRAAAAEIERLQASGGSGTAITSPGIPQIKPPTNPTVPVIVQPAPTLPAVVLPAVNNRRYVTVKKGEGPSQITARVLGNGNRWKELVSANAPPKKINSKTGNFTSLNPGEKLLVPATWPDSPHLTTAAGTPTVTTPAPIVTPGPSILTSPTAPSPAVIPVRRLVVVGKGEGPYQITKRVLGAAQANRWKELVAANVPPKKRDSKGNFTSLNPGEKLIVPESWPQSPQTVMGGDPHYSKTLRAGKIALGLHFGNLSPSTLREWQHREGLPATGQYTPYEALTLCYRYGFVPPAPRRFESPKQAKNFVAAIKRRARQDPQRADEYSKVIRDTIGFCKG